MELSTERHERYARARARGSKKAEAAVEAGYSASRSHSQGYHLDKRPEIQARIAEIVGELAEKQALALPSMVQDARLLKAVTVQKNYVLNVLIRNIEEARAAGQYAVVKGSVELLAKVSGVYIEGIKHTYDFPTDLSQCTEEQLKALSDLLLTLRFGQDEGRKREAQKRLELEAGLVIDAVPEVTPEW